MRNPNLTRTGLTFLLISSCLLFSGSSSDPSYNDGSLYELDLDNPSLYEISCYETLNSSQWTVKNETCTLTSAVVNLPGDPHIDPAIDIPINLAISRTGNLEADDDVYIHYSLDGTNWVEVAHVPGTDIQLGASITGWKADNITPGNDIIFRIIMKTNEASEKITLHSNEGVDGGMFIGTPFFAGSYTMFKSGALPVTLTSFEGIMDDKSIELTWTTASEINNSHFEVERSSDGLNFKTLTIIQGNGNSNTAHQYEATDYTPLPATSYYRLKQVDFDGKFAYSSLIAVNNLSGSSNCKMSVRPNPCLGQCTVLLEDCPEATEKGFTVYVYDALGNVVSSQIAPVSEGGASLSLDASGAYKPGVYIVRGTVADAKAMDEKVVIAN